MWGERLFGGPARTGPPEPPAPGLVAELAAAGLPDELAAAADDESWDAALSHSLDAARKACGPHPLSPTLVLDGESLNGLSGPVFSRHRPAKPHCGPGMRCDCCSPSLVSSS